jgi:hypothetical protein
MSIETALDVIKSLKDTDLEHCLKKMLRCTRKSLKKEEFVPKIAPYLTPANDLTADQRSEAVTDLSTLRWKGLATLSLLFLLTSEEESLDWQALGSYLTNLGRLKDQIQYAADIDVENVQTLLKSRKKTKKFLRKKASSLKDARSNLLTNVEKRQSFALESIQQTEMSNDEFHLLRKNIRNLLHFFTVLAKSLEINQTLYPIICELKAIVDALATERAAVEKAEAFAGTDLPDAVIQMSNETKELIRHFFVGNEAK